MSNQALPIVAIIGGTGALGTGLARRWAEAGYRVLIGSRTQENAEAALQDLQNVMQQRAVAIAGVQAMDNISAAQAADIVVLTVPFAHQISTLEQLAPTIQGKILVDVTVPLVPPKVGRVQLPEAGSAGAGAQKFLGADVNVVSAFQNVAAHHLQTGQGLDCDVLVCGNSVEAREQVISLVEACGMRGIHAGPIANAAAAEAMTSILIGINKRYKCHAGIKITGLE